MKKVFCLLFIIAFAVALGGCNNGTSDTADSALMDADEAGVMAPPVPPDPVR